MSSQGTLHWKREAEDGQPERWSRGKVQPATAGLKVEEGHWLEETHPMGGSYNNPNCGTPTSTLTRGKTDVLE